jgi:hypothetical protein
VSLRCLCAVLLVLCVGCENTGGGPINTDTGKVRAERERLERDTRPIMRGTGTTATTQAPVASAEPASEAAESSAVGADSAAEAAAEEDVAAPTAPLVTDAGGAPAVLVDVVRPAAGALDDYAPVADDELSLVQVQRGGANVPLQRGMALALGDEVLTGDSTVAILNYPPNIEIYVMPSTQIRVGSIFVKLGEIWVSIKGQLKEKFKVETEFVTAGVEGTEFLFRADRDGGVDVDVMKGSVLCTSKLGRWAPIRMARLQKFSARRDQARPITRNLAATDVARVRSRVKPVSVAVATKLPARAVIPLDKQIYTLPADKPAPDMRTRPPVGDAPIKPDIKTLPDQGTIITKPPVTQLPASPDIRALPRPSTPIAKPPATQLPATPDIKALPKPGTTITRPPATTLPKSTTTPRRTLPKE